MSFEFTVLSDDRFIEILDAWVDSPWPKTAEDGYALRDHLGWTADSQDPAAHTPQQPLGRLRLAVATRPLRCSPWQQDAHTRWR